MQARGVALETPHVSGHGFADYLLYIDGKAAGIVEAKKEGFTLVGVEVQSEKYSKGLPADLLPISAPAISVSKHRCGNAFHERPRSPAA